MMPEFVNQLNAENDASPSMNPIPLPESDDDAERIDYLLNRVSNVVAESAQMGTEPLTTIANVLAQLYQAKALAELASVAVEIRDVLQEIQEEVFGLRVTATVIGENEQQYLRESKDAAGIGSEMLRSDDPK